MIRLGLFVVVSICLLLVAFERPARAQDPSNGSAFDQLLDEAIEESDSEFDTPPPPTISDMLGVPSPSSNNASAPAVARPSFAPNTTLAMILLGVGGAIYLFLELFAEVHV
jgi:hypothetical protein